MFDPSKSVFDNYDIGRLMKYKEEEEKISKMEAEVKLIRQRVDGLKEKSEYLRSHKDDYSESEFKAECEKVQNELNEISKKISG